MKLEFITGNKNKFEELKEIIPHVTQTEIDLPEIQEIDPQKIIESKLQEAFKHRSSEFIVEDTSLYLDAMNGLPGPLIKWFIKAMGNEGIFNMAQKLGNTHATAKTIIGLGVTKDSTHFFEGVVEGEIVAPRGDNGFGWDPIFQPKGYTKTLAEMTVDEKRDVKPRNIASKKLHNYLNSRNYNS